MLSLICIAIVIVIFAIVKSKKTNIAIRDVMVLFVGVPLVFLIFVIIFMITSICSYDENVRLHNYYNDTIAQLETQMDKIDISIEKVWTDSKLSREELSEKLQELETKKQEVEEEISVYNEKLDNTRYIREETLKRYKFLVYFGN